MEIKMHYVCIENNKIVSVLNYSPSVPDTIQVVEISDNDYKGIVNQTHYFDIDDRKIKAISIEASNKKEIEQSNAIEREFLNKTDWMILRHLRQKFLGVTTSLSEQDFTDLEQKRHEAAGRIVDSK